jgi:hypothetical protein
MTGSLRKVNKIYREKRKLRLMKREIKMSGAMKATIRPT